MGPAMKAVNARVAGRADGKTVATLVKARLAGG
ncbi:MAG: GatB/YqeY domain-containing protein [Acidimicrobiia bacterium]